MFTIARRTLLLPLGLCLCLGAWLALPAGLEAAPRPGAGAALGAGEPGGLRAVSQAAEEVPGSDQTAPPGGGWVGGRGLFPGVDRCQDVPAEQGRLCSLLGYQPARWRPLQGDEGGSASDETEVGALGDDSGGLIGANLPICTYSDDVSNTESLDESSVAYNPSSGKYLVVWHAVSRTTGYDIFGRFVTASGTTAGPIFSIYQGSGNQKFPNVTYDSSMNQYWVTWSDFDVSYTTSNVRLQRFSATGTALGGPITVNAAGTIAYESRVACGAGRCVVVWDNYLNSNTAQILAQSYDSSGNPATSAMLLSDAAGAADWPDIAFNSADSNFLVAWEQIMGNSWDVLGIGITPAVALLSKVTISSASANQLLPRVAYSAGAGSYLVVWNDYRNTHNWDIYGQLVGRNFALVGNALAIYAGPYNDEYPAVVGLDTSSQFLVAYQTDTNGGGLFQMHAGLVSGTGSVGSQFIVREWNNQRGYAAVAAQSGSSNYLVTFTDNGMTTQPDIFGQVVTSSAQLSGSLIAVARGRKGQEFPTVAYDSTHNEYLAVWMDYRSGSDYQIYGRRVSSTGVVQGSELAIGNQPTSILYGYPVVAYDPTADEYLVVWAEIHSQATGYDVYARRVKWDGSFPGTPFLVSRDSNSGDEGSPAVAYNPTANEYLVTWNAYDSSGHWRVWGQRVAPAGTLSGSGFVISASTANCAPPKLAYNPATNQYLVIWEDYRNSLDSIYDQLVNANGTMAGGNFAVTTASGAKEGYSVAYGAAGNDYLAVWGDSRSGYAVYGQQMNSNAAFVGGEFAIAPSSAAAAVPTVAYDAKNHDFLVAWQQPGATTDVDIWARRVPESGALSNAAFAVSTATDVQDYVELAQDTTNGQFLLVWQDFRATSYDIYAQLWAQSSCSLSLSSTSQSFSAAGGTGFVNVTLVSGSNCGWTATSNASWITVTGGASGTDNGTVNYSVAANTGAARSGTITVVGQTFTVSQAALSCTYALSASSASLAASGGNGSFNVTTASGCAWTASPSASWIHITSGSSGNGSGAVGFSVDANTGSARSGTITVADQTFTVNQAAVSCSYALSASSASMAASGGSGSFSVTAGSGCAWTASPSVSWIHITSGSSGSGNGTVGFSVDANTGSARSGTITVSDETFTINQAAGGSTSGYSHWLPAVINKDVPSKNAKWRSDIAVLNRSSQTTTVEIRFYSAHGVLSSTFSLAGNAQLFLPNVVGQLGYSGDGAALEVRSDQDVFLSGRTYNQVDATHTYGQDYDGQSSDALLSAGQSAWLPQLTESSLFRTNIGITNTGSANASVTLTLYDGQGNVKWIDSRTLAPAALFQYQQPYLPFGGIDQGYAKVTVNAGSGIVAYASVADQNTGDPTTISMKR